MRVAILISGQLRNWRLAADNHEWFWRSINRPELEIDYFIHTWNYSCDRPGASIPYTQRTVPLSEYEEVVEYYKPKKSIFEAKSQKEFYNNDHWSGLFYSFCQTLLLKKEYELEHNFNYDIVIKTRPDVVFNPSQTCYIPKLSNGVIHSPHGGLMEMEFNMYNIDEIVFVGNSYTMDLLVNLYAYRQLKIRQSEEGITNVHPLGPGTLMHEYFRDYGITPIFGQLNWHETLIKEGCPTDVDMFNAEDFKRMETYFREWYGK